MLFLRLDQALELLREAKNMKERLVIRYFVFNGLSPMELANARIEDLDPIENTLYLPRRHWKTKCVADVDAETVRLQIVYSGDLREGPLIRSQRGGHYNVKGLWDIVKKVARRTTLPNREKISPIVLKRTFAREWLASRGTLGSLQKQLGHKHLWSTAHYLRYVLDDVRRNHGRFMSRIALKETLNHREEPPRAPEQTVRKRGDVHGEAHEEARP